MSVLLHDGIYYYYCSGQRRSVPVEKFAEYVKDLHDSDDYLFEEEYDVS